MIRQLTLCLIFFFFNDTATTEIYTLSLHDALPIFQKSRSGTRQNLLHIPVHLRRERVECQNFLTQIDIQSKRETLDRSEEHTSELQSQSNLVCRLLLEKKKTTIQHPLFSSRARLLP